MQNHIIKSLAVLALGAMLLDRSVPPGLFPRRKMQLMVKVGDHPARKVVVIK